MRSVSFLESTPCTFRVVCFFLQHSLASAGVGVSSCRKGKICLWDLRMNAKSIHDKGMSHSRHLPSSLCLLHHSPALSPVRPGSLGFTPIGMLQDTWACGCGQEYNTKTQSTLQLFDDHHNVKRKLKLCPGTRSPPAVASSGQLPVSTTGVKLSPCGTFVYSVGSDRYRCAFSSLSSPLTAFSVPSKSGTCECAGAAQSRSQPSRSSKATLAARP